MPLNFKSNATALDSLYATYSDVGLIGTQLFTWGYNNIGQLGLNDGTNRSSPTVVGSGNWSVIDSRSTQSLLGIKSDGTLWGAGLGSFGELGNNSTSNYYVVFTQIGSNTNWSSLGAGFLFNLGRKTDGTLWSWGYNADGQLGLNNYGTNYSSPTQVGTNTNWSVIAAGRYISAGIKTDGTLWTWGRNQYGQLGLNGVDYRSSPVQVGSNTNWSKLGPGYDTMLAIKTDGTLWAWGYGQRGLLGLNDRVDRSSPVQVGSNTNWSSITAGDFQATAIKTDGSLWTWGTNETGNLGQNNLTSYSSPVQVGSGTNWSKVISGPYHVLALKTDGTLWAWGQNAYGQLGQGSANNSSSPVQVGTGTSWADIGGRNFGAAALLSFPYVAP